MPPTEQRQAGAVARLEAENAALQAESAKLRQRLEELERQVGLDSSNSSKPPARRRTRSLRGKSGRKSGGQRGHKGHTLRQSATPEHIEEHRPEHCGSCCVELHFLRTLSALF